MCEPATIATTLAVVSTVAKGYAAKQKGDFDYGVAKYNSRRLENEATQIQNRGTEDENKQRRATAELISKQRARLAASGVDVESGTASQIQDDTALLGEVDALRIRSNAIDQAQVSQDNSQLTLRQGRAARNAGDTAFGISLLSAGANAAGGFSGKWYNSDSSLLAGTPTPSDPGLV